MSLLLLIDAIVFPSWLSEEIISLGPISLRWYGLSYVIGLFGAYWYATKMVARKDIWTVKGHTRQHELIPNKDMLSDLMFYSLIGIIVGGRLGYLVFYSPETFLTPIEVLKVWKGGMSFHGGFLGVCGAVLYMRWRKKLSLWRVADMAAIGAPIGLGAVRLLGNFINQELWGRPTDVPWAFIFTKDPASLPRHPSQLYEAFLEGLVIFLVLRVLSTRYKALTKPGVCAGTFIMLYGLFRFLVEFVREPDATMFGPLTRGMTYSLPMVVIGLAIVIWAAKRAPVAPKRLRDEPS
ncbi:prolipoprotein diacylglyceryl transferase [Litorimonas sp. RW-G-Af-16]|uniref:prolipoprotein diacylglyceryl transferase n=1 Tax=Litorimonas sp. RW-G-Af-16 TaxID=3241168 RepID=UPI00390CA892